MSSWIMWQWGRQLGLYANQQIHLHPLQRTLCVSPRHFTTREELVQSKNSWNAFSADIRWHFTMQILLPLEHSTGWCKHAESTSGETKSLRVPQVLHLSVWAILQSDFKALNIHHNEFNQSVVYRSATAKYSTGNFWKQFLLQFPLQLQIETCS